MLNRKSLLSGLALTAVLAAACSDANVTGVPEQTGPAPSFAASEAAAVPIDLIAGQNMDAGDVLVWHAAGKINVKLIAGTGWKICETHVDIATAAAPSLTGIPRTPTGNPKVGHFDYKTEHDPCVTDVTHQIPYSGTFTRVIAVHAVVAGNESCTDIDDVVAGLPLTANACVYHWSTGAPNYPAFFPTVQLTNAGIMNGNFMGWCVDLNTSTPIGPIGSGLPQSYCFPQPVSVRSTYPYGSASFPFMVAPQNLDKVNWLLNQNYVGQAGPGGVIGFRDVQRAIWALIEPGEPVNTAGSTVPFSQANVDFMVNAANGQGLGFVPACDQYFGVVLVPAGSEQPLVVPMPVECECTTDEETAWGQGSGFPGANWAMYFTYTPN